MAELRAAARAVVEAADKMAATLWDDWEEIGGPQIARPTWVAARDDFLAALEGDSRIRELTQSGMTETAFSPFYRGQCVTPLSGCWAGETSENEARVTAAACAHTLETGHETAVTRESSFHYRLARDESGA